MKNTKKIISLVLAICMLASLAISASAANTVDASGGTGNSSIGQTSAPVSAEIVTIALPPVGMDWLMVSIFAPQLAKMDNIEDRTPALSFRTIWKVIMRPAIIFWNGEMQSRYL